MSALTAEEATSEIVTLLHAAKMEEAVACYTQYREDLGYLLLNRAGSDAQMQKVVANLLYRARDYDKAASCCENLGELEKAATLYALSENYPMAAEMFTRVGQDIKAAEMFERARNYRHACELYLKAGDRIRAAQNAERAGELLRAGTLLAGQNKHQQALEVLQKVKRGDSDFLDASLLVAELLEKSGHADIAARKLQALKATGDLDANSARVSYALARLAEKRGATGEAKALYSEIIAWDVAFKDAHARLQALANAEDIPSIDAEPLADEDGVVTVMEGFEYLKQLPLFETLSLNDLRAFFDLCEKVPLAPGDVLIRQGVPGEALFVITEGSLEVRKITNSGDAKTVATLPTGSYVGEMGLVDDSPTSAEVRAASAGSALKISKANFHQLLRTSDRMALSIYRVFVRTLSERLRQTTAKV